jgi:uncharacterized protein (DUF58 family)
MESASDREAKQRLAAHIGAVLALAATRNNDRVGMLAFSDRVEHTVPPKKARGHVMRLIHDLLTFEPRGQGTRIDLACDWLGQVAKRRSVVFFLSDFLSQDPAAWEHPFAVAARKHDLVPIIPVARLERSVPKLGGILWMQDLETGALVPVDSGSARMRSDLEQQWAVAAARRDTFFRKHGLEPIAVPIQPSPEETRKLYARALISYFRRRARRQ